MLNTKVTYMRLHQSAYVPGVGEVGSTFPSQTKTLDSLQMHTAELGVVMEFSFRGVKKRVLIPSANIVIADLALE